MTTREKFERFLECMLPDETQRALMLYLLDRSNEPVSFVEAAEDLGLGLAEAYWALNALRNKKFVTRADDKFTMNTHARSNQCDIRAPGSSADLPVDPPSPG